MMRLLLALPSLVLGAAQCESPSPAAPVRPPQVIVVGEGYDHPFRAESGDRLDLIMEPTGDWVDRCQHSGGTPYQHPHTDLLICESVDF